MGPEIIRSSQDEKRHPRSSTAKEEIRGPRVGDIEATAAHSAIAYGNWAGAQISAKEAPAVAKQGEHMKPRRKRRTISPAKLSTRAVGMQRMTKKKPETA